jgi:phenylacetate-CoA ligase
MRGVAEDFLGRDELEGRQSERLRSLLAEVLPRNRFLAGKLAAAGVRPEEVRGVCDLARLPFTTKAELLADQEAAPPYGHALTYPLSQYCRLHQTSGTTGRPLRWLDTRESWDWMLGCWQQVYRVAGVTVADRLLFAFSFGPFLGFWTAFEAADRLGCLCLPAGGMSSGASCGC